MIRKMDRILWLLLGIVHRWTLRCGLAYQNREKVRRFRKHLLWEKLKGR